MEKSRNKLQRQIEIKCSQCGISLGYFILSPNEVLIGSENASQTTLLHTNNNRKQYCFNCANAIGRIYNVLNSELSIGENLYREDLNNYKTIEEYHIPINNDNASFLYKTNRVKFWQVVEQYRFYFKNKYFKRSK